ncbi:MAG: hypothetical protein Tsb0014_02990 [Pleurocapsa sp.]
MSASQPTDLSLDKALKILKSYDCVQVKNPESPVLLEELRNSLVMITNLSTSENLGICADSSQQGFAVLASYLKAFGYPSNFGQDKVTQISEPVYLKFNTQKMSYYLDRYTGKYRGVLISCQSEDDAIAGTYGHFSLDLFLASAS